MTRSRPPGSFGDPGKLSSVDMESWSRLRCIEILPWEVELFTSLEEVWRSVMVTHLKKRWSTDPKEKANG